MIRALMTAASGMKAQQLEVDTIANNIANVNTTGFKKSDVSFRDMLYQTFREPGSLTTANSMSPTGLQIGSGTEVAGTSKQFRQGELVPTGAPFDMAISGEGFFRVLLPNGEFRYTRDGSFRLDGNGQLVNADGHMLDPAITIPQDAIEVIIGDDGTVSVLTSPGEPPQAVTNISLFRFPNPTGLKAQGGNLFSETPSSGAVFSANPGLDGTGTLRQGFLERSNVAIVDELVALILAQRNYEINSRAISVSDEMLQQVNQMIR
jgi:flagellar basal-body rod protein FlgG